MYTAVLASSYKHRVSQYASAIFAQPHSSRWANVFLRWPSPREFIVEINFMMERPVRTAGLALKSVTADTTTRYSATSVGQLSLFVDSFYAVARSQLFSLNALISPS